MGSPTSSVPAAGVESATLTALTARLATISAPEVSPTASGSNPEPLPVTALPGAGG